MVFTALGLFARVCLLIVCFRCYCGAVFPTNDEKYLVEDMLSHYDVNARPVLDPQRPVLVQVLFILHAVQNVDEESQSVVSVGEFTFVWVDEYLSWNKTKYEHIKMLALDKSRVWLPDVELVNNNGDRLSIGVSEKEKVKVTSEGNITWSTKGKYVTSCLISVRKFPFDQHTCAIVIGPNVFSAEQQRLSSLDGATSAVEQNSLWTVLNTSLTCSDTAHAYADPADSTCMFQFTISRRSDRHVVFILTPVLVLSIMSCFVFTLSAKTVEKVTFILLMLLTYTVVLASIRDSLPVTSHNLSYLSLYVAFQFGVLGSCLYWL